MQQYIVQGFVIYVEADDNRQAEMINKELFETLDEIAKTYKIRYKLIQVPALLLGTIAPYWDDEKTGEWRGLKRQER